MSIWNDCEEHDALPFFGFPVKPTIEDGYLIFNFPLGYEPNGSQTKEVMDNLVNSIGVDGDFNSFTDKIVRVRIDDAKLARFIYEKYTKMH